MGEACQNGDRDMKMFFLRVSMSDISLIIHRYPANPFFGNLSRPDGTLMGEALLSLAYVSCHKKQGSSAMHQQRPILF